MITTLNSENIHHSLEFLRIADPDLGHLLSTMGPPPMWEREEGFATLVNIILEQQVSLVSAKAAFEKLQLAVGQLTPDSFLKIHDEELKKIGFSRQKTEYCRALARTILDNQLELNQFSNSDDKSVRNRLTQLKGIGLWTAEIYLLMALMRPNAFPNTDLALAISVQEIKQLSTRPTPLELEQIAQIWQPWRAVAARMLWFSYLRKRGMG